MALYSVKAETEAYSFHAMIVAESGEEVIDKITDYSESTGLGKVDPLKTIVSKSVSDTSYIYDIKKKG